MRRACSTTSWTRISGAEALAVRPRTLTPSSHSGRMSPARSIRCEATPLARATSHRRSELEQFGAPSTSSMSTCGAMRLHGVLPVLGRVADVLLRRRVHVGKRRLRIAEDLAGVVERQGRLGQVGDALGVGDLDRLGVLARPDEPDRVRRLAERADGLVVVVVADQDDRVPCAGRSGSPRGGPW